MNNKLMPALMAGVAFGVLLVIFALVGALSPAVGTVTGCCACLLPIFAGMLAVYLYVSKSPTPAQIADGAMLGALAGLIGGLIYLIVGVPLAYFVNAAAMEAQFAQLRSQGIELPVTGLPLLFIGGIIGVVIYTIMSIIGGLIGVPVFEKRKGGSNTPPPPPPNFGGTPPPPASGFGNQPGGYGTGQPGGFGR